MKKNKLFKFKKLAFVLSCSILCSALSSLTTNAESFSGSAPAVSYDLEYSYTGEEQTFTAPYTGVYQFGLYGAQGANSTYEGGYGGRLNVSLALKKGDTVTITVGGQDGYNGGGTGKVTNGGGATDIMVNDEIVAIAGGGGGGTTKKAGGAGGASSSGNNNTFFFGSSSTASGSAGGGGGFVGGKIGRYYSGTTTVSHKWKITDIKCLGTTSETPRVEGEQNSSWRSYTATLTPITTDLNTPSGTIKWDYFFAGQREGETVYASWTAGDFKSQSTQWTGEKPSSTLVISREGTQPVNINNPSYGGSSWYDSSICTLVDDYGGQQAGDGYCGVKLLSLYQLVYDNTTCQEVYYNGTKVKAVYYGNTLIYKNAVDEEYDSTI